MTKNTGVEYEIVTQIIFDAILNRTDVKTIDVQRNIPLQGKDTLHQIDIYWEFQVGGTTYHTVVQAKDLAKRVTKGQLLEFESVLRDLPNQPRGIFVTRTGYQKGALEVAKANGIVLYELRKPTARDTKGRLHVILLNLFACVPHAGEISFTFDSEWMVQEGMRLGLKEIPEMHLRLEPQDTVICDQSGTGFVTVKELTDSFYPSGFEELPATRVVHKFEKPTFIMSGVAEFPKLKVDQVEATISIGRIEETITLDADDLVGFVLKNILEGTEQILDKEGKRLI
jgi:hypothetical protein